MTGEKTISEKIMSAHSGTDARAGQIVEAEIDYVMANDVTRRWPSRSSSPGLPSGQGQDRADPRPLRAEQDVASAEQAAEMRSS